MIREFVPIARAVIGVKNLKIITFGPRPQDFFACNAPIKGLYDLGVEIEENSELDLLVAYQGPRRRQPDSEAVVPTWPEELGVTGQQLCRSSCPGMAQYELTLLDWAEDHRGSPEVCGLCR